MTQQQALTLMESGASVFLTGPPGAGKTYVLNEFVRRSLQAGKRVAVTASTGIAATHIGGTTVHTWSGLGARETLTASGRAELARSSRLRKCYRATDILVVDEVSMLHGRRLDMLNEVSKLLRRSDEPCGGLQVILAGDLFQLPPVHRHTEPVDFVHTSAAWTELELNVCYLTEQHRQAGGGLLDVLGAIRESALEISHATALRERLGVRPPGDTPVTHLCTHNADADAINGRRLTELRGCTKTYVMATRGGRSTATRQLMESVLALPRIDLKPGAEVMFVANNQVEGYVNGSRGRVTGFKHGLPRVQLASTGRTLTVEPYKWALRDDGQTRAEVVQLPLRLAWGITIHKSQGMSLDAAEIDLRKAFMPGMGYVALSRVRTMEGVYLQGLNTMALRLHPEIIELDKQLRSASDLVAARTAVTNSQPVQVASHDNRNRPALAWAGGGWGLGKVLRDCLASRKNEVINRKDVNCYG